jgi:zinc protease
MSATVATAIVSQSGLGDFDFIGLQKKLAGNTAKVAPYINNLHEGITGSCSPKDLETMLQLNYMYFTAVRRDETAFNAYVSRIRNMIKPMRSNPLVIFQDTLTKIVSSFSKRVIAVPTDAQIDKISLDRVMAIFSDRFSDAGDFTYFMIGNFKTDSVVPLLETYLGGLPAKGRKEEWKDVEPGFPEGKVIAYVPKNSEPQSRVAMIWNGDFRWKDRDKLGFAMLMNILSIKLRESMREDQGGVYGVSFSGSPTRYPTPEYSITSMWGCNPDNTEKLSQTVLDEMSRIRKNGPAMEDLYKVKETFIRERETMIRENSYWLSALQNLFLNGDRLMTLDEYKAFVNSFTVKDIKKIADKYLDTEHYVKVTLTPAERKE